jgi:hypothetical protein
MSSTCIFRQANNTMTTFVLSSDLTASGIVKAWSSSGEIGGICIGGRTAPSKPKNPVVPDEFGSGADGLRKIYNDLKGLFVVDPDDDSAPPSGRTLKRAYAILEQTAYAMMRQQTRSVDSNSLFPRGYVTTDDKGAIRVEWWREQTHCVSLVVGGSKKSKPYVFVKVGSSDRGHIEPEVIPAQLAARLKELNKATV